ncbi:MAG: DUF167 domain-containing protein [Phycisphaeraceae bacterium]
MPAPDLTTVISAIPGGVSMRLKVVPGASRSRIVGVLGDRLKVAVAAPPEGGKANEAVCELLAQALGVPRRDVAITEGPSRAQKTASITAISPIDAAARLVDCIA